MGSSRTNMATLSSEETMFSTSVHRRGHSQMVHRARKDIDVTILSFYCFGPFKLVLWDNHSASPITFLENSFES
ncbi:hypothetical protein Tsubulata_040040 [Turnera subulata]|uniref:Uncharacterized protein n=1 Tax=Turnera subulata TaxID=218843 RepID=A0A9Q0FSV7_9ROSI|nr:hypothetical protein Tsubulata_040040 [Turnera subulata]